MDMPQYAFAVYLGISPSSYIGYEHGDRTPGGQVLAQIAARGYDINELLAEEIEYEKRRMEAKDLRCNGMGR